MLDNNTPYYIALHYTKLFCNVQCSSHTVLCNTALQYTTRQRTAVRHRCAVLHNTTAPSPSSYPSPYPPPSPPASGEWPGCWGNVTVKNIYTGFYNLGPKRLFHSFSFHPQFIVRVSFSQFLYNFLVIASSQKPKYMFLFSSFPKSSSKERPRRKWPNLFPKGFPKASKWKKKWRLQ